MQRTTEQAVARARWRAGSARRRLSIAPAGLTCLLLIMAAADVVAGAEPSQRSAPGEVDPPPAAGGEVIEAETAEPHGEGNGLQRAVDALHAGISARVEGAAKRIDSFFADDRFYADTTETYARISLKTTFESGESAESEARLRVRLDLPGTEERLRLFIEGGEPEVGEGTASGSIPEAIDDNDYSVGLEGQLGRSDRWDVRPGIGVKAAAPPDPFVRIRATRYAHLGQWLSRFSAGAAQFLDDGSEVQSRLDFDRKLNEDWLFRSASRARWLDRKDRIDFTQTLTLFHRLSARAGLSYDVGLRADDDPDWQLDSYFAQVRVRYRAYNKWLFIEAAPQLVFREDDDYDPTPRFGLRVDAVFGAPYR
jgi:hypothetical protein